MMTEKTASPKILLLCLVGFFLSGSVIAREPDGVPALKIVYFTPSDRTPPPHREERLGRVMKQVQDFFRKEMERNGFGPMTFALEWTAPNKLKLYEVTGEKPTGEYGRKSGWNVHAESKTFLAAQGIDIDKEYVLILTPLILWKEDGTTTEWGPYAGSGTTFSGFAWAFDDALLDSELLPSREPGGYFFGHCSLGVFNTKYIGGIAHELGHCFGLPHECQSREQRKTLGTSLMGSGNHTYGEELRNEGLGTFLSPSAALRLSICRAFCPDYQANLPPSSWKIKSLQGEMLDGKMVLSGQGDAGTPPIGVIAYNDDQSDTHDYDATSWIGLPDSAGNFRILVDDLKQVLYELRLAQVFPSGEIRTVSARYDNTSGTPDLEPIDTAIPRMEIKKALQDSRTEDAVKILRSLAKQYPDNEEWRRKIKHMNTLKKPRPDIALNRIAFGTKQVDLTLAETRQAKPGWLSPTKRRVPEDGFIEVNRRFYESGFYAHAPSLYAFVPEKKWKKLKFGIGLQDGHPGSVVFVVRGDGKELFRSRTIKSNEIQWERIDIADVEILELVTEDSGDGTGHDWGIWVEPRLSR